MALYNLARMTTATTGTGATITLGSAVPGFLTFALAGVPNGATVSYGIIDGVNSETGTGTYTTAGTTLTRTVTKSTNADARISLSGSAIVSITARAEDLNLGNYLPLTGGTLTGDLSIDKTNPGIFLNKSAASQQCYIVGSKGAFLSRWDLILGDIAPESTGNAGSDFIINRYDDAGSFINAPLTITRSTGVVTVNSASLTGVPVAPTAATATNTTQIATTAFVKAQGYKTQTDLDAYLPTSGAAPMTGRLQFLMSNPFIELQKSGSGEASYIVSRNVANARWLLNLGNVTPELGSNSGSDFVLSRYNDGGTSIGSITVTRSDGLISSTGDLEIKKPTAPTIALNKTVATVANGVYGQTNGVNRWNILLGHGLAETGSDAGSNFFIQRFTDGGAATTCISIVRSTGVVTIADANLTGSPTTVTAATADNSTAVASTAHVKANLGSYLTTTTATATYLPLAGGTLTGNLTISKAGPTFVLNKAASGQTAAIFSQMGGDTRWLMHLGNTTAEGGSNTGSDFQLVRYNDAGGSLGACITITRSTGVVAITDANLSGAPVTVTPATADNSTAIASTAYVKAQAYATLASPALSGTPTAPTAAVGTTTTQIATTAFVDAEAVAKTGDTMTGDLALSKSGPNISLKKSVAASANSITGYNGANKRWDIFLGNSTAETADAGSDFQILRYNDAGTGTGAIFISRLTGAVTFAGGLGATTTVTPATLDNSTSIATTAYVQSNIANYAPLASPALSGTPTAPTASVGTTTTQLATTAFVDAEAVAKAGDTMTGLLTASGGLTTGTNEFTVSNTGQTGIGTASPTASWVKLGASTTAIAHLNLTSGVAPTTPVDGDIWRQDNTTTGLKYRVGGVTQSFTYDTDLVIYAPLASPALTGTPTAPTAATATNTTQVATTAYVKSNLTPQVDTLVTLTYSASISTNAALGNRFIITATNGTAFTINAPTNPSTGQQLTYTIKNTSGGALGTITWNAVFKKPAFVTAATANNRSISFFYDGTNWIMLAAGTTDVPN